MNNFWIKFKSHFPQNKTIWKQYTLTTLPVIFSTLIFALNSFVDNFMSINIAGGNQALSYANQWTEIQLGIISATTIIGAALFSQYVGKQDWTRVKEIINLRILFSFFIALIFALPSMILPQFMIQLVSGFDANVSDNIRNQAIDYLRMISISWLLNSFAFTMAMILREKNYGFVTVISSIITLLLNIVFNAIFIYALNLGIVFLAYSTIISNIASIIFMMLWIWFKDQLIFCNVLKIFKISSYTAKHFFRRISSFLLFAISSILINIRFIFWNVGYGTGTIGDPAYRLSAATILGITLMFFNIFWTTMESMSATVAVYIGKELGNNQIENAKNNAKQLQGFHFILGLILGTAACLFSLAVGQMHFLTGGYEKELISYYELNPLPSNYSLDQIIEGGKIEFLTNVKFSLIGIGVFIPMFFWFVSRSRFVSIGGLTNSISLIEAILSGLQIAWLVIICYLWNNNLSFSWAWFVFFTSDIIKFIVYEIFYQRVNWARNITHSEKSNNESFKIETQNS